MQNISYSILSTLILTLILTTNAPAQDYTKWHLPEGAIVRLGKGSVREVSILLMAQSWQWQAASEYGSTTHKQVKNSIFLLNLRIRSGVSRLV